ncbi:MAG TPA: hypothetical protein VGJ57_03300 [Nitrospirales bacterium]
MQAISSSSSLPSAPGLSMPTSRSRTSDLTQLKASAETHTDLSVITAGGDRITLSAESLFRASSVDLKYHGTDQASSLDLHGTASASQIRSSYQVSVQGQIDPQEEADVRQLVEKLQTIVNNFLGGDIEGAVGKALKIGDLGTVSSFQLNVRQSEQIAITQQYASAERVDAAAPAQPWSLPGHERQGNIPSLANQLASGIREANIDSNTLLKHLPDVLRHLFDRLDNKVSEQDLTHLSSDIEKWLAETSHALEAATEPIAPPA